MTFGDAIIAALTETDAPGISDYEFFILGATLFASKTWQGKPLSRLPSAWDWERMRNAQRRLRTRGFVAPDADFKAGMWRVVQSTRAGSSDEIMCIADPFCYVSHLSAMERYGLTDRSPESLHLTTPARKLWNSLRDRKVARDAEYLRSTSIPKLTRIVHEEKVRRRLIAVHETAHPAEPTEIRGERTRISTIGRTFVDMLDRPDLCGGMRHILGVWERHADEWVDSIVKEVDEFSSKIVKVRAGYIFTEKLNIEKPEISRWEAYAQRGGSRKLDPFSDYVAKFSDRWMISINI